MDPIRKPKLAGRTVEKELGSSPPAAPFRFEFIPSPESQEDSLSPTTTPTSSPSPLVVPSTSTSYQDKVTEEVEIFPEATSSSASFIASSTTVFIAKPSTFTSNPSKEKVAEAGTKEKETLEHKEASQSSSSKPISSSQNSQKKEPEDEETSEAKKTRLLNEWHAKAVTFFRSNRLIYGALLATTSSSGRIFRRVYNNFPFLFPVISADGRKMYPVYRRVFTDEDLLSLSEQILDQWEFHHEFYGPISKPAIDLLKLSQPLIKMSQMGKKILT